MTDKLEIKLKYNKFDLHDVTKKQIKTPCEECIQLELVGPYRIHKIQATLEDAANPHSKKVYSGKTYTKGNSDTEYKPYNIPDVVKIEELIENVLKPHWGSEDMAQLIVDYALKTSNGKDNAKAICIYTSARVPDDQSG